jgi:ABC-type sugar transport system permease subunit
VITDGYIKKSKKYYPKSIKELLRLEGKIFIRFEVFTPVAMKNLVFWDVMPCGSLRNQFIFSIIRVTRICELGTTLAVTSNRSILQRNIMSTIFMQGVC